MKGKKNNVKISKTTRKNSSKWIQCYECQGYGHVANDREHKNSKKKALNTTWEEDTSDDNDENLESDKSDINKGKFIAFIASTGSVPSHVSFDNGID